MRVLVLGSSGFLGRLLCRELVQRGADVEGWSRSAPQGEPLARHRCVDLLDSAALPRRCGPWDAVALLAGPSVPARWDERAPRETLGLAANALALLARTAPGARLVVSSSAHVLATATHPQGETEPPDPQGAYGRAKLEVERLALARCAELDVRVARIFGSLGPGLPAGLFVPDLLARLHERPRVLRLAGPDAQRDLTDGRDVAAALAALLEKDGLRGSTFHVASGRALRLSELARALGERLGFRGEIVFAPSEGPGWIGAHERLTAATGWTPRRSLDESLDWIVAAQQAAPA